MRQILFLLAIIAGLTFSLTAQVQTTGAIRGTVRDPTGAVVPGAKVTVTGPALMTARVTVSAASGSFLVSNLPPGGYIVAATKNGFKAFLQSGVTLSAGFTATVNPSLEVGAISQKVEVSGVAPSVNVTSATTATTFGTALLQNLPSGRDPWSTLEQAPGVASTTFDVGGNNTFYQSSMSVHGSVTGQMVYSYDGLDLSWPGGGGGATSFYNDHDALEELQTVTDAAPANVGVGGVYINMISKSGSNDVHGQASTYYETAGMEAAVNPPVYKGNPVLTGQPIVMSRDTEVGMGAPIIKDRWWIYGAWRLFDTSESQLSLQGTNPTTGEFQTPPSYPNHQSNITLRNDWQVSPNNRVFFSWWWNEQNQFKRATSFTFTQPQAAQLQIEPAYNLIWGWTWSITPNVVLDSRLGYQHLIFPLRYEPGVTPTSVAVEDVGYSELANAATSDLVEPATEWRASQQLSWFVGRAAGSHNVEFGWGDSTNRNGIDQFVNLNVRELFDDSNPYEIQVLDGPTNEFSLFHEGNVWGQDAWTIRHRLTLTVGLRWDHWNGWIPSQSNPAVAAGPGGADLSKTFLTGSGAVFPGFADRSVPQTPVALWNTWSPRVSVTYDPTGRATSVVSASFDRFQISEGTGLAESINPNNLVGYTYTWANAPSGCTFSNFAACGQPAPSQWGTLVGPIGGVHEILDPSLKRPYSDQITVGYQQQLPRGLVFATHYYHRTNINQFGTYNTLVPTSAYTPVTATNPLDGSPITIYAEDPSLVGKTSNLFTNAAPSNTNAYNAVELTATKHMSSNWQLLAGLTIQRNRGNYYSSSSENFNDPNNLDSFADTSYLGLDSTYITKISGSYQLPSWHLLTALSYQHYTGYPLLPTAIFTSAQGLSKGQVESVPLTAAGAAGSRLPGVDELDLRISRPVQLTERFHLEPMIDLFNVTNSNSITGEIASVPQPGQAGRYLLPSNTLNPFIARLGIKLTF